MPREGPTRLDSAARRANIFRIQKMKALNLTFVATLLACGCNQDHTSPERATVSSVVTQSPDATRPATAQFSPDGKRIVTATQDGTARIWDAQTGQALPPSSRVITQVWDVARGQPAPKRYHAETIDNMPVVGGDNFKVLQDQIDALQKRVEDLEKKASPSGR